MKRLFSFHLICPILLLTLFFAAGRASSQCSSPQSAGNVTATFASCPGNGAIHLSFISPAASPSGSFQFALFTPGGQLVRSWQNDSTLTNVEAGSYEIYIRQICPSGVSDTLRVAASVVSTYRPLVLYGVYPTDAVNCCNGNIYVDTYPLATYSLVNSLNAPDIPANYIRPRQTDPQFNGLCAGTYYVRVYDECNNYQTRTTEIRLETRTYSFTASSLFRVACDSLQFDYLVASPSAPGTSWVEWPNGMADTALFIPGIPLHRGRIIAHFSRLDPAYTPSQSFPSSVNTWPVPIKVGFRDECGTITRYDYQIQKPGPLNAQMEKWSSKCDSTEYKVSLSYGTWPYRGKEATYSLDGGATWAPLPSSSGTFFFGIRQGQTYTVKIAVCGDTLTNTVQAAPAPPFLGTIRQLRGTGCEADIYVSGGNLLGTLSVDMIRAPAAVSPYPTGTAMPGGQTFVFRNLPLGTYTFRLKDSSETCFRTIDGSITTEQIPLGIKLKAENFSACKNRARIGLYPTGSGGNTITDDRPLFVKVLQQPAGADIPATFSITDWRDGIYFPAQLQNMIPGDYAFAFLDTTGGCPRSTTASITLSPDLMLNSDFTVSFSCEGKARVTTASGFQYLSEYGLRYAQPFQGNATVTFLDAAGNPVSAFRAGSSFNTATAQTTLEFTGISADVRTVRLQLPEGDTLQPGCSVTRKAVTLGTPPLTLSGVRFLANCAGNAQSATLTAPARGGSGTYTYALYQGSVAPGNLVAGPQASFVFNNLNANTTYVVEVTDECGSATRFTTGTAETSIPLFVSSSLVCPGDNITFSVDSLPGASYQWTKNGTVLSGQTGHLLALSHVQTPADTGSYQVNIILGGCQLLSNSSRLQINCTPTPVVLMGFTAVNDGEKARLDWATTSETKNLGFDIQRSTDGKVWERLGFVPSQALAGTSLQPLKYRYWDPQAAAPVQYYRLKQIDLDGKTEVSSVRSVAFPHLSWQVYPNPASRAVFLHRVPAGSGISLTDLGGREVHAGRQESEGPYRIDRVPAGLYLLHVKSPEGGSRSEKILVTP